MLYYTYLNKNNKKRVGYILYTSCNMCRTWSYTTTRLTCMFNFVLWLYVCSRVVTYRKGITYINYTYIQYYITCNSMYAGYTTPWTCTYGLSFQEELLRKRTPFQVKTYIGRIQQNLNQNGVGTATVTIIVPTLIRDVLVLSKMGYFLYTYN